MKFAGMGVAPSAISLGRTFLAVDFGKRAPTGSIVADRTAAGKNVCAPAQKLHIAGKIGLGRGVAALP